MPRGVHARYGLQPGVVGVGLARLHQRLPAAHHVVGRQLVAVVKLYAAAQVEGPDLAVLHPVVRQHRHGLHGLVQVHHALKHQLVEADHVPVVGGHGAVGGVARLDVADGHVRVLHVQLLGQLVLGGHLRLQPAAQIRGQVLGVRAGTEQAQRQRQRAKPPERTTLDTSHNTSIPSSHSFGWRRLGSWTA